MIVVNKLLKNNLVWTRIGTALLWLLSCALGLIAIYAVIRLSQMVFALSTSQSMQSVGLYYSTVLTGQIAALVSGGVWLVMVIWSGEYSLRHVGERRLWKIFAWIIGIEVFLIFAAWIFNLF